MLSKHILSFGAPYIRRVIPSTIKRKCICTPNFRICFQEDKINFIKYNYYSTYEDPPIHDPSWYIESRFSDEEYAKLQKWIKMVRYEGGRVPKNIPEEEILNLLSLDSEFKKLSHLNYLFSKEVAKEKATTRKARLKELKRLKQEERESKKKGHILYGLWKNTMFAKANTTHMRAYRNSKLINAMMYNQPLVIDLDYYDNMNGREISSLAEQLGISISRNRLSSEPFNLTFCNVDFNCKKFQWLYKRMPNIMKPNFPMNIVSESYLDIFPKEKLVYLTPNAREEMKEFDYEAIYIIGGLVDLQEVLPLTHAKAKRENIKMLKLPIDKYHITRPKFRKGNCSLAIHVMVNILLDLQKDGDWKKAFKNIPRRLLLTGNEEHLLPYDYKYKYKFNI